MDQPINYCQLTGSIATSGQPTEAQIHAIADQGYDVVVNLAMHNSDNALPHEGSLVASLGMNYVNLPVPFDEPTEEHFRWFTGVMDTFADRKVWVHCAINARVSAFMFRYLTEVRGVTADQATTPLLAKWRPTMDDAWRNFLGGDRAN